MGKSQRILTMGAVALLAGACGPLVELPGQGPAPQMFNLTQPSPPEASPSRSIKATLLVEEPNAPREIDTDRIALHPSPIEVSYYKDARWSDRAPRLLQTLLIQALYRTNAFEFVDREAGGISASHSLQASLIDFEAVYDGGRPTVHVTLKLTLVERARGLLVASTTTSSEAEASQDSVRAVVVAFDEATTQVVNEATAWTIEAVRASLAAEGAPVRKSDQPLP